MKTTQSYNTRLKARILGVFKQKGDGLMSAADVYEALTADGVELNLTTVYRNLDAMTRDGVLMKFSEEGAGRSIYKYSGEDGGCRSHLHAKCTKCGKVTHLDCSFMRELAEHARSSHGFYLCCEQSMLYGECEKCQEEKTGKRTGK